MNRIVFTALAATSAVAALAAAAPASAQSGGYGGNGYGNANIEVRADQLQMRLQAGVRSGAITRSEAMPLREQLRELTRLEMLYARGGINGRERADLQQRMSSLRQALRMAERGADGRYGRDDDRDDRYGRDDDRDDRYGRDDDRYGRGDVDGRYDRDDDGRDDRDGRGVVGQVLDLRVGQRVSTDLGGVPNAYRGQYRDSDTVYYRSDGRNIYQVDARTRTVVRVHSMNR